MRTAGRLTWTCLALCFFAAAACGAAEPVDPERIEELSVAAARQLAAEHTGTRIGAGRKPERFLALPRLRTLTPEAAAALAEYEGSTLRLDGLTTLSPEVARALAGCRVEMLGLDGVTALAPEAAAALAESGPQNLSLAALADAIDRVPALTRDDAGLLALVARHRHPRAPSWPVRLGGIEGLDATENGLETARMLATVNRELLLPKLVRIAPESARLLAEFKGPQLELPALEEIDPAAAEALAACPARLQMVGLRRRFTRLPGLSPADEPLVRLMSRESMGVRLESLESLDTPEAVITARTLAAATTFINLPNVRRISAAAAHELAAFKGEMLVLDGLAELDPAAAEALAAVSVNQLRLRGLRELLPETAAHLARSGNPDTSDLHLDGVTTLSAETARVLAGFTGNQLFLTGLKELSPAAVEALGEARCQVRCWTPEMCARFDAIGIDQAGVLALASRQRVALKLQNAVTIDSVEAAAALAALPVRIYMPSLRRISPEVFLTLIAKQDVVVPPLESIEFIADPQVATGDDFALPDDFEDRQKNLRGGDRRPPQP